MQFIKESDSTGRIRNIKYCFGTKIPADPDFASQFNTFDDFCICKTDFCNMEVEKLPILNPKHINMIRASTDTKTKIITPKPRSSENIGSGSSGNFVPGSKPSVRNSTENNCGKFRSNIWTVFTMIFLKMYYWFSFFWNAAFNCFKVVTNYLIFHANKYYLWNFWIMGFSLNTK